MSDEELDKAFFNEDPYFESLIGRDEDTTMRNSTHCAYDKIITTEGLTDMVVERDTKVFNLREEWNLSEEEGLQISDHFPVQVGFKLQDER